MIHPKTKAVPTDVGRHYDELDAYYRQVWGDHVHHGLWNQTDEPPEKAVENLVHHLAACVELTPGERVCDVGCGYGATARLLAKEYGSQVVGLTISRRQYEYARNQSKGQDSIEFHLCDWLENGLDSKSFDVVIAIESSEHVEDKQAYFREAYRVLRPGGRFAVYAWLAKPNASRWQVDRLLEPICREGRLPGMGTKDEYQSLITDAGFTDISFEALTKRVRRTWTVCIGRLLKLALTDKTARRFAMAGPENRVFLKTVFRIWFAYWCGAMRYGLFTARKPLD